MPWLKFGFQVNVLLANHTFAGELIDVAIQHEAGGSPGEARRRTSAILVQVLVVGVWWRGSQQPAVGVHGDWNWCAARQTCALQPCTWLAWPPTPPAHLE